MDEDNVSPVKVYHQKKLVLLLLDMQKISE